MPFPRSAPAERRASVQNVELRHAEIDGPRMVAARRRRELRGAREIGDRAFFVFEARMHRASKGEEVRLARCVADHLEDPYRLVERDDGRGPAIDRGVRGPLEADRPCLVATRSRLPQHPRRVAEHHDGIVEASEAHVMRTETEQREALAAQIAEAARHRQRLVEVSLRVSTGASDLALRSTELHEPEDELARIGATPALLDVVGDGRDDVGRDAALGTVELEARAGVLSHRVGRTRKRAGLREERARALPLAETGEQASQPGEPERLERRIVHSARPRDRGLVGGGRSLGATEIVQRTGQREPRASTEKRMGDRLVFERPAKLRRPSVPAVRGACAPARALRGGEDEDRPRRASERSRRRR